MKKRGLGLAFGVLSLALVGLWLVTPASAAGSTDGRHRHRRARFEGDHAVHLGLVLATADVTYLRVAEIHKQLTAGKSIQQIAASAGKSAADVLVRFDAGVDQIFGRRATRGKLPASVAAARAAWYKQSARLQVDQPGLTPAFPGLHELHIAVIGAAAQVSGIPRPDLRAGLESCKTLAALVAAKGKSGTDIVDQLIIHVDSLLQTAVANGKLTPAQRDRWRTAIQTAAATMVTTPGLHVAGVACAH